MRDGNSRESASFGTRLGMGIESWVNMETDLALSSVG